MMRGHDIVVVYLANWEQAGIVIPDFRERMLGAHDFEGIDGLRFFAKMGWTDAYASAPAFCVGLGE